MPVARPASRTSSWLIAHKTVPTTSATATVRGRCGRQTAGISCTGRFMAHYAAWADNFINWHALSSSRLVVLVRAAGQPAAVEDVDRASLPALGRNRYW